MPPQPPPSEDVVHLAPGVSVASSALEFTFSRSSGPGGQNVNKRATRAQLRVALGEIRGLSDGARHRLELNASSWLNDAGELVIASDETRSQRRNRDACVERLRALVRRAVVEPKRRRPTRVPRWAQERRLEDKRRRSDVKRGRRGDW